MGCSSSVQRLPAPIPPTPPVAAEQAGSGAQHQHHQRDLQNSRNVLDNSKWAMLIDWTGWLERDQFGWEQPQLSDVVDVTGRSKLAGVPRPHNYQVAISFPGADFDKGSEGHRADLTDHDGKVLAASGTEMAEALQQWLVEDWLDGDEQRGLTHVFVCSKNLKYCPGSVKAKSFRHYSGRQADDSTAILNENWAMYLRESFVEARVVVFVINEDWLDSIPCNQEFEAVITRKRKYRPESQDAIVFVDITDDRYNERWGAKLPQFKEGLAFEAGKHFDVVQLKYNSQTSAADKLAVRKRLAEAVAKYSTKHPPMPGPVIQDLMGGANEVHWPNWLYYRSLTGTNGWESILETHAVDDSDGFARVDPWIQVVTREVAARRFRVRVMGVTGDTFNEGYKYMCHPIQLMDDQGRNIVSEGRGHWRAAGERMGTLGFSHWCGPKQYSWLEWLVPDDEPPVVIKSVDVRVNARHWVVEVMPVSIWPSNGEAVKDFKRLAFDDGAADGQALADKPPTWVSLHTVTGAGDGGDANDSRDAGKWFTVDRQLLCKSFRLRILKTAPGAEQLSFSLKLQAEYPDGLYPLGGGIVSGTGGNTELEDAPPAFAFDGDPETRWVDVNGGGIGNTAYLEYEHPETVEVVEYSITTQMYALSSYHSHLNGAPRDWELKAFVQGQWLVVDQRSQVYLTNHRETKRFVVDKPTGSNRYRLEFTAVAAGCASRSIQVGNVELFARMPARTETLKRHQVAVLPSALRHASPEQVKAAGPFLAEAYGLSWPQPDLLDLSLPSHPEGLAVLHGGKLGWTLGEGRVSNWYDHPLEIAMEPKVNGDDPDARFETRAMLVVRPRKEAIKVDHVHTVSFRREYPGGEAELVYTHVRPVTVKGYSLRSSSGYVRGDPRSWVLEAWTDAGDWVQVHRVTNFSFPDRLATATFYVLDNTVQATKYRMVIVEINAMIGLLHLSDLVLFTLPDPTGTAGDATPVLHSELGHVTLRVKAREGSSGSIQLSSYQVAAGSSPEGAAPQAWVLEGLTSGY